MFRKFFLFLLFISLIGCSIDYKEANKKAVERLRNQLLEGKYEEIYNQSENNIKYYISKEEFLGNMKLAVSTMKEFDESLTWQQDEAADEHRVQEVYGYDRASWRTMEKNGKRLNIDIWWSSNFSFCDLTMSEDFSDKPEIVVTRCSKE
ncbi:MAG: hypothetical protein M3Q99_17415 [Acidobacteriota bacterium]|nr:hypothetical protein [Acidobacteriota bacterium]